jgi:excisionase family DNA binding protein
VSNTWISPTDLAAETGTSRWTIYDAIRDGRLRAFRYGRKEFQIRREDADRYIETCRVKPRPIVHRGGRLPREHHGEVFEIARRLIR